MDLKENGGCSNGCFLLRPLDIHGRHCQIRFAPHGRGRDKADRFLDANSEWKGCKARFLPLGLEDM